MDYPKPALTADAVLFDTTGRILLVRRKNPPFQGAYALPGGFVEPAETVEQAAARELYEETGMRAVALHLCGVYSAPGRDPRGWTVSVAFLGLSAANTLRPCAGDDAADAAFFRPDTLPPLAFDHAQIVRDALKQAPQYGILS